MDLGQAVYSPLGMRNRQADPPFLSALIYAKEVQSRVQACPPESAPGHRIEDCDMHSPIRCLDDSSGVEILEGFCMIGKTIAGLALKYCWARDDVPDEVPGVP